MSDMARRLVYSYSSHIELRVDSRQKDRTLAAINVANIGVASVPIGERFPDEKKMQDIHWLLSASQKHPVTINVYSDGSLGATFDFPEGDGDERTDETIRGYESDVIRHVVAELKSLEADKLGFRILRATRMSTVEEGGVTPVTIDPIAPTAELLALADRARKRPETIIAYEADLIRAVAAELESLRAEANKGRMLAVILLMKRDDARIRRADADRLADVAMSHFWQGYVAALDAIDAAMTAEARPDE